jgi:DNA-binding transcriptional ArsR family regulator
LRTPFAFACWRSSSRKERRACRTSNRALGIEQPIVSQQLARLRASGIVAASRHGSVTRYSVADPLLKTLLRVAKQILNRRLVRVESLLRELKRR